MTEYLKCDAEGCDHVEVVGVIEESMIGMACPKCSANLLTADDYAFFVATTKPLGKALEALGISKPASFGDPDAFSIGNHKGDLTVRIPGRTLASGEQP